ncbi:hypothetical protein [Arenimonas alkanexedens]
MNVMTPSQTAQVSGGNSALIKMATFLWSNREALAEVASEAALEMADLDAECGNP